MNNMKHGGGGPPYHSATASNGNEYGQVMSNLGLHKTTNNNYINEPSRPGVLSPEGK
jgi:hypothetical protein